MDCCSHEPPIDIKSRDASSVHGKNSYLFAGKVAHLQPSERPLHESNLSFSGTEG